LAELRRRAQMRQQAESSRPSAPPPTEPRPVPPPPIISIPGSTGPTVPARRTPFQAAPPRTPPPTVQRPVQRSRQQQKPAKKALPPRPVLAPPDESSTHRLVPEQPQARLSPVVSAAPQTPEEWRRAIIANEILSPPVAIRPHEVPVPF
jgi:hypothetical protein